MTSAHRTADFDTDFDSDDDEISLCSTTWTEEQSDYAPKDYVVEKILAEEEQPDGDTFFLLKWKGYPIVRASWADEEEVPHPCVQMWLEHKAQIDAHRIEPFNVEQWYHDVEQARERMYRRRAQRAAKRCRLRITQKYRRNQSSSFSTPDASEHVTEASRPGVAPYESPRIARPLSTSKADDSSSLCISSLTRVSPVRSRGEPKTKSSTSSSALRRRRATDPDTHRHLTTHPQVGVSAFAAGNAALAGKPGKTRDIFANWNETAKVKKRPQHTHKSSSVEDASSRGRRPGGVMLMTRYLEIKHANSTELAPPPYDEMLAAYNKSPVQQPVVPTEDCSPIVNEPARPADARPSIPKGPKVRKNKAVKKWRTCKFWASGWCRLTDEECLFAHHWLEEASNQTRRAGVAQQDPQDPQPEHSTSTLLTVARTDRPTQASTTLHASLTSQMFQNVDIELHSVSSRVVSLIISTCGPQPQLAVTFSATSRSYNVFASSKPQASVSLHYGDLNFAGSDGDAGAHRYRDCLDHQANESGFEGLASVVIRKHWAMLIYPASKAILFGDAPTPSHDNSNRSLRFQIIVPFRSDNDPPTVAMTDPQSISINETFVRYVYRHFAGITATDIDGLFDWITRTKIARRIFLRFEHYPHERDLLTILIGSAAETKNSDQPGAWEKFVQNLTDEEAQKSDLRGGVVIFHPANLKIQAIDQLSKVLHLSVNFYIFGPSTDDHWERYNTLQPTQLWQIFTHGTAVMIVDDMFEHHPERTYKVVQHIVKKTENTPWTKRTWKLFARPRLLKWLLELCHQHAEEIRQNPEHVRLLLHGKISSELCPPHMCVAPEFEDPNASATLIGDTPKEWNACGKILLDGGRASEELEVLRFATWSLCQYFKFRRYVVVVPEVTATYERLKSEWKHIDIITPEKYLGRYSHF